MNNPPAATTAPLPTSALVTTTRTATASEPDGDCLTLAHLRALVIECDGLPGDLPAFGATGYSDLYTAKTVGSLTITSTPERTYCRVVGCYNKADQVIDHRGYCDEHAAAKTADAPTAVTE